MWFHLYAGYQDLKDDLFLVPDFITGGSSPQTRLLLGQADARNVYAGGEITYSYKQLFGFNASAVYRNWNTPSNENATYTESIILGFKPALEANVRSDVSPLSALRLSLGYQHIERS